VGEAILAAFASASGVGPSQARHVKSAVSGDILRLIEDDESFRPLSAPFTPDHLVYCRARFLRVNACVGAGGDGVDGAGNVGIRDKLRQAVGRFVARYGYLPRVVCVRGAGAFFAGSTEKEAENARLLFCDAVEVALRARAFGGALHMPDDLVDFISNWEVEAYRQQVAAEDS
jgi:rhamnose utilization protein RhaD (predicted bifunctional aldolase and dehydrogenase)